MAAAAAPGAVEAVTTPLERHGGSAQLQPPDPPPALSKQFPTPNAVKPPARVTAALTNQPPRECRGAGLCCRGDG